MALDRQSADGTHGALHTEIGLTPASRSRITSVNPPVAEEPNPIERIIIEAPDRPGREGAKRRLQSDGNLFINAEDANL